MPTGYTAGVGDGTITTFEEYALKCARAFGATLEMRDEPLSADPPPPLVPDKSYAEKITQDQAEIERIEGLSDGECAEAANQDYNEKLSQHNQQISDDLLTAARYSTMLDHAKRFKPPTTEHAEYAKFLISQLEDSLGFDCNRSGGPPPEAWTGAKWRNRRLEWLRRTVARNLCNQAKDYERVNARNEWVSALLEAIRE